MFDLILLIVATLSICEIIAIEYNFGIKVLDEPLKRIILVLSYSVLGSSIFYFINIYLPKRCKQKYYKKILKSKIDELLLYRLQSLRARLVKHSTANEYDDVAYEKLIKSDNDNIRFLWLIIDKISLRCCEILQLSVYVNPEMLEIIDRLYFLCKLLLSNNYKEDDIDHFIYDTFITFQEVLELQDKLNELNIKNKIIDL